jgi:23S rRNA (adenine2503-C2)-methyltransferase
MKQTPPNLYDLDLAALEDLLQSWNQPAYRARQIFRQLYVNLAPSATTMTDLPQTLRTRLAEETRIGALELVTIQQADQGTTRKALFRLNDGAVVEAVLMVYSDRATVCVSTQAGCAMGCVFCATGKLGLLRNLTPGEIIEQAVWAAREARLVTPKAPSAFRTNAQVPLPENAWWSETPKLPAGQSARLSNLVFMGMGEPFANYDRWWQSVERLHDPSGLNLGSRSMTVSTVGLPPGIRRLASERLPINLAISIHAPNDELRSAMMPVNNRYPLSALLAATDDYIAATNRRVSFEYVLLQGKNDHPELAEDLVRLCRRRLVHVNLIPWNPIPGEPLGRSEWGRVLAFQRILQEANVACTVRVERGVAIAAACGQLAGTVTSSSSTIPVIS